MITGLQNDFRFKWDDREIDPRSNPYPKNSDDTVVSFKYQTMNVEVESEVVWVDFNSFVSATGGSLGLFLGFSIIDTLFYIFDLVYKKTYLRPI